MKNNLNNSELISRYFEGRFSEDELRWFNRKLAEDRDLAAEFRLYLEIDKAIEYMKKAINYFKEKELVYNIHTLSRAKTDIDRWKKEESGKEDVSSRRKL